MKKVIYFVFLFISIIFISCSSKENKYNELFINVGSEPKTIDPALSISIADSTYIIHAFEGLLSKDKEGKLIGAAAESWDISEDGLVYTFHLRTNAKWSDGVNVTAEDFVYSWKRVVDRNTASEGSLQLEPIKNARDIIFGKLNSDSLGVKAINDYTFEVTLERPMPYFLELTSLSTFYPVRKDIIEKYGDTWTMNPESYVCNGPYMILERSIDDKIVMVKNVNYWDYWNIIPEKITFVIMNNPTSSEAAIKEGSLHFSTILQNNDIDKLRNEGYVQYISKLGVIYYALNITNEVLKDDRVRKALSLVIDRNYIVNNVVKSGLPAGALVPFGIPYSEGDFREVGGDYISVKPEDYATNLYEARRLMAEAGYPNGNNFPVITFLSDSTASSQIFEAVQHMWKETLNIDSTIDQEELAVFLQTFFTDKNYVLARGGWTADYTDPMTFLSLFLSYSPQNHSSFSNEEYDNLIISSMSMTNEIERMNTLHKAEKILFDNDVIIPLYYDTVPILISPKLKNVVYDTLSRYRFNYAYLDE
ncbi:peptide ABC transporter substrate-binding protein [uncultured Brachyspira sp.]|uniref:peptide ABC transporter substrate-binding protein n=1 Tax=uncultured Brachyspira sp. TaxID=221953 RepID=UPI00260BB8E3|nr:peptide ABC transporter substrate-binding protein [uncultured Brachyspira sp.]